MTALVVSPKHLEILKRPFHFGTSLFFPPLFCEGPKSMIPMGNEKTPGVAREKLPVDPTRPTHPSSWAIPPDITRKGDKAAKRTAFSKSQVSQPFFGWWVCHAQCYGNPYHGTIAASIVS